MSGRRLTIVAFAIGVASALAQTAGQFVLADLPAAESTLEAIAMRPDVWVISHVLIALAVVGYAMVVVLILTTARPSIHGRRTRVARSLIVAVGLVLAVSGVLVQGAVLGIDAVIGGLALASVDNARELHRVIGEQVLPIFDAVDIGLTIALMLAALVALIDRRASVVGPTVLITALAVPGFTELRIIAPALVAAGFAVALVLAVRAGSAGPSGPPLPALAAGVLAVAVLPAAALSVERLVLAVVVLTALVALLVVGRADARASVPPMRTGDAAM
jgi:hypothetical protein